MWSAMLEVSVFCLMNKGSSRKEEKKKSRKSSIRKEARDPKRERFFREQSVGIGG